MKKLIRIAIVAAVVVATSCTNSTITLKIKDQNGNSHYYGQKPIETVEMWCFIHERYEKVEVK